MYTLLSVTEVTYEGDQASDTRWAFDNSPEKMAGASEIQLLSQKAISTLKNPSTGGFSTEFTFFSSSQKS